ncbi:MAG TPA: DUF11 domain-containing protein, partial [Verrucomicrobiae bacterium]|nr:DUF11 domain-containing protein [Verrucomicrobiae bacterium]
MTRGENKVQRGALRLGPVVSFGKGFPDGSRRPVSARLAAILFALLSVPLFAVGADLRVGQVVSAARVAIGANVTFTISVTNGGPTAASSITLTSAISPRATFVSSTPSQGTCTLVGRSVSCSLGDLALDAVATVAVTVMAGSGTNENVVSVSAAEPDTNPSDNISIRSTVGVMLQEYSNPEAVLLPELDPGPASIYPLNISVSGLTSAVDKVTVTLRNITHFWPDDLDVLLVGPGGVRVLLMSDCGLDNVISDVTLTFDDAAATSLPNSDPAITAG